MFNMPSQNVIDLQSLGVSDPLLDFMNSTTSIGSDDCFAIDTRQDEIYERYKTFQVTLTAGREDLGINITGACTVLLVDDEGRFLIPLNRVIAACG